MGTRALERTGLRPCHGDSDPGFIDTDQLAGRDGRDGLPVGVTWLLDLGALLCCRMQRLFFLPL